MMSVLAAIVRVALVVLALRGARWAYFTFIAAGLAYFPMHVGFQFQPRACQLVFGPRLAVHSLTNFPHIILFGIFFVISAIHFRVSRRTDDRMFVLTAIATLTVGALVEIAEGVTGAGNCRLRDLIPDLAGVLLGATALMVWQMIRPVLTRFVPNTTRPRRPLGPAKRTDGG
jgi:hypothetical protein